MLIFREDKSRNLEFLQYGIIVPSEIKSEHFDGFIGEKHIYSLILYFINVHALLACLGYDLHLWYSNLLGMSTSAVSLFPV